MSSSRILAIDGALGAFSAALSAGKQMMTRSGVGNASLERGLPLIDELLDQAECRLTDVDAFASGLGPGTFTGLRIALAFAKSLAFATGRPLIGVSSFDIVEERALGRFDEGSGVARAWFIEPRAGILCVRFIDGAGSLEMSGSAPDVLERLRDVAGTATVIAAGLPESLFTTVSKQELRLEMISLPQELPAVTIAKRARKMPLPPIQEVHALRANYGEMPATTQRRT